MIKESLRCYGCYVLRVGKYERKEMYGKVSAY